MSNESLFVSEDGKLVAPWGWVDIAVRDVIVNDILTLFGANEAVGDRCINLVTVPRGGLTIATIISHELDSRGIYNTLSFIGYSGTDGNDVEAEFVDNNIQESSPIVVIDDIIDSGKTVDAVSQLLVNSGYSWEYKKFTALFNSGKYDLTAVRYPCNISYVVESRGMWVVFPWEVL